MARSDASPIYNSLTSLLPRRRIRDLARKLGVVRRRRKLDVVALVYALVLGFGAGERRGRSRAGGARGSAVGRGRAGRGGAGCGALRCGRS